MVADERSALLHMTGIAGVVDAVPSHHAGPGRSMRVMTIGTNDFAFPDRVTGGSIDLCALFFMTGKTHFRLSRSNSYFVIFSVYLVTGGTSHIPISMNTAAPMHLLAALMTIQAGLISFFNGIA